MIPSRRHPPRALLVFAVTLAGCTTGPAPSPPAAPSQLALASATPSASATVSRSASASVAATLGASPSVEPSAETIDPAPIVDPTRDPTPSPTPVAGCGTGEAGFDANAGTIPRALAFGGATLEFTTAMITMRDGSFWADDAIPGGVGLTPNESAVVVRPGEHIVLRAAGARLSQPNVGAGPWTRVTFDGLANLPARMVGLPWRPRPDGSLSISAPDEVGDWVVQFIPTWETACLRGDGTAYGRIKVRAP